MATLEVPNRYLAAAAPVIITSPTTRCGTTLIQRLISSSDNAFVYGEEVGHQIRTLTGWLVGQIQYQERTGASQDTDFEAALAGTLASWRPGLMPPSQIMMRAWVETFYQIPTLLSDYGQAIGRPVWGFKGPSYSRDTLKSFLSVMPRAKIVYVFRNLIDVLKSAKARRFVISVEDVSAFCAEWATNMREVSEIASDERVLFLKYEELLAQRQDYMRLLELFTGAENISEAAFELKVNTYEGDQIYGYSPSQYIEPMELSAVDRASVIREAGPILAHLYGESAVAAVAAAA
jgi:hypothetical protein